ncbi:MAG: PqqD family protein [Candidatus Bathyarchaeia archaeon]
MLDRFKRKKKPKKPTISRSDFFKVRPVRNPGVKWEKDDSGKIQLLIPIRQESVRKKGFSKILVRLFPKPDVKEKKVQLDKIGSFVWELCDSNRTVEEIVNSLNEEYKMIPREAEISLRIYFEQLTKRGLLGFIFPEKVRERLKEAIEEA